MRLYLATFFVINSFSSSSAQNLVPNWSFEDTVQCPDNPDQLNRALGWFNPTVGTPDYFNACCQPPAYMGVPTNGWGYQKAHTGTAYAGCYLGGIALSPPNNREYLEIQLTDSLQAGHLFGVTFYVSLWNQASMTTSRVGCYFSDTIVSSGSVFPLPFVPQVENSFGNFLTDTCNWIRVSGIYNAFGSERYLTICNFYNDSSTDTIRLNNNGYNNYYIYIDDVSVIEIVPTIAGADDSVCKGESVQLGAPPTQEVYYSWQPASGLSDPNISNPVASPVTTTLYTLTQTQCGVVSTASVLITVRNCGPDPAPIIPTTLGQGQMLEILYLEPGSYLQVYDSRGRLVFFSENYHNEFGAHIVSGGIYFAALTRPGGPVITKKIAVLN